jgi:hypothetical protein
VATSLTLFADRAVSIPDASLSEVTIEINRKSAHFFLSPLFTCAVSLLIFVLNIQEKK